MNRLEEIRDINPILAEKIDQLINAIASHAEVVELYLPDFFPHIYPLLSNLQDRTRDAWNIAVERREETLDWAQNQRELHRNKGETQ